MFRVIVAGGRDFNNYAGLAQKLDKLLANVTDEIVIVCGMARGCRPSGRTICQGTWLLCPLFSC